MYFIRALLAATLCVCISHQYYVHGNTATEELNTCEEQLSKYRRFLLQAILSFEDVCDAYSTHPMNPLEAFYRHDQQVDGAAAAPFIRAYQAGGAAVEQRSEIWAFFKLLMAQFNDLEFTNIIKDAVIERCRIKSQLQRDEKRNSVVLGKKQRFHSWGGKRSQLGLDDTHTPVTYNDLM